MPLKSSTIFDRWIRANADRLTFDSSDFTRAAASVSFFLKMIEGNPKGLSPGTADAATQAFAQFKGGLSIRPDIMPPNIKLPKIKVVRPRSPNAR